MMIVISANATEVETDEPPVGLEDTDLTPRAIQPCTKIFDRKKIILEQLRLGHPSETKDVIHTSMRENICVLEKQLCEK